MEFKEMFDIGEETHTLGDKNKEVNLIKHVCIRLGVLIGVISLIFAVLCLVDKHSGALGALYLSFYFFCLWLFYLIIETVIFYVLKKNSRGNTNLVSIIIVVLISALVIYEFA